VRGRGRGRVWSSRSNAQAREKEGALDVSPCERSSWKMRGFLLLVRDRDLGHVLTSGWWCVAVGDARVFEVEF